MCANEFRYRHTWNPKEHIESLKLQVASEPPDVALGTSARASHSVALTFPTLLSVNIVPHAIVRSPAIKLFLLLHYNCNLATVMKCNVNVKKILVVLGDFCERGI